MEAYCFKCRSKREIRNPQQVTLKNGRPATQGVCPQCGTACAGVFESQPGTWGSRRLPVLLSDFGR